MKNKTSKIYQGDVRITQENQAEWTKKLENIEEITGYLDIYSDVELPKLTSVGGSLDISSNVEAKFPKLTSVGGYLYIYNKISNNLEKTLLKLYKKNKKNWFVNNSVSETLLSALDKKDNVKYFLGIQNVEFPKELFHKVRKGELSAEEVFAIENTEQRRVAYEMLDKTKMKQLKDFKVLDKVKDDGYGYPMKIVRFKTKQYKEPFVYLNCFCPSTGREYFIETDEKKCWVAKSKSFSMSAKEKFDEEY